MFDILLYAHSIIRWLVLFGLAFALFTAYKGYSQKLPFTRSANAIRHWTATLAHIQLTIGLIIYSKSPIVSYFWGNAKEAMHELQPSFYGLIHSTLMLIAIVVITIGSALAKRKTEANDKYKTMLLWFGIGLFIIFIAIPWPFSPLASRPYLR